MMMMMMMMSMTAVLFLCIIINWALNSKLTGTTITD
jgi:hypothetical protein